MYNELRDLKLFFGRTYRVCRKAVDAGKKGDWQLFIGDFERTAELIEEVEMLQEQTSKPELRLALSRAVREAFEELERFEESLGERGMLD